MFGTELKPAVKSQSQTSEAKPMKKDGFSANKKPVDGNVNELLDDTNRPVQKVCINVNLFEIIIIRFSVFHSESS